MSAETPALAFPDGRRFAFTIMDDTDVATVANVAPVYHCLAELGLRTTKTAWPVSCPQGSRDYGSSETLEEPGYLAFVRDLAARGFEIAFHSATMESSPRGRTEVALARFTALLGHAPRVHANHAQNRENLYWGVERLDDPIIRAFYRHTNGQRDDYYRGHVEGSAWWWGDLARASITYVRNLTFDELNVRRINPTMPYHDRGRPLVPWWFSASDAEDGDEFVELVSPRALDRLEREGGVAIVATHLGKEFTAQGALRHDVRARLEDVATRRGWFVPVGELLDWLRAGRPEAAGTLPPAEWRAMQWRWARDLVARRLRRQAHGWLARARPPRRESAVAFNAPRGAS